VSKRYIKKGDIMSEQKNNICLKPERKACMLYCMTYGLMRRFGGKKSEFNG